MIKGFTKKYKDIKKEEKRVKFINIRNNRCNKNRENCKILLNLNSVPDW